MPVVRMPPGQRLLAHVEVKVEIFVVVELDVLLLQLAPILAAVASGLHRRARGPGPGRLIHDGELPCLTLLSFR